MAVRHGPAGGVMGWRVRHLPVPLATSGVLAVAAAAVGGVVGGGSAAIGAGAGVVLVAAGYVFSTLVVAWADATAPRLVLPFGMAAYLLKVSVLGAVLTLAALAGWSGLVPMAWGVAAGVLGWIAAHIWWFTRGHRAAVVTKGV